MLRSSPVTRHSLLLLQSVRHLSGDGGRRSRGPRNTKSFDWYVRGTERLAGLQGAAVDAVASKPPPGSLKTALPEPSLKGITRTRIFLELQQGHSNEEATATSKRDPVVLGRLVFTLANDLLPKTCENFVNLVERGTLRRTSFHRMIKNVALMGGDVKNTDGKSSVSSFPEEPLFPDENFAVPHSTAGILSMTNAGIDTNGSQFFISLAPLPHLNGRNVAFGALDPASLPLLQRIAASTFTFRQRPTTPLVIGNCGVLESATRTQADVA